MNRKLLKLCLLFATTMPLLNYAAASNKMKPEQLKYQEATQLQRLNQVAE